MSTIASRTLTQSFTDSRAHLNDAADDIFHDAILLPFAAQVHAEIQDAYALSGIPLVETVVDNLSYTALAETIVTSAVTDLQYPLELWEKSTDSDSVWVPMKRVERVGPNEPAPLPFLGIWEWTNGAIRVPKCSDDRTIFMRYRRQLAYPTSGQAVGFDGFYWPLVFGTAYRAADATGRTEMSVKLAAIYYKRLADSIRIASRDRQIISFRPQSPARTRPWWGFGPFDS